PDTRTMPTPPAPGGVAIAAMVSACRCMLRIIAEGPGAGDAWFASVSVSTHARAATALLRGRAVHRSPGNRIAGRGSAGVLQDAREQEVRAQGLHGRTRARSWSAPALPRPARLRYPALAPRTGLTGTQAPTLHGAVQSHHRARSSAEGSRS